jgi:hypothetical protein
MLPFLPSKMPSRRFVETRVPVLKTLNPNTFFGISELNADYKTPGYARVVFRNRMALTTLPSSSDNPNS